MRPAPGDPFPLREEEATPTDTPLTRADRDDPAYQRAVKAAANGDATNTCLALLESPVLDGIRRRLTSALWWELSDEEANEVMADAVDDLFVAMTIRPGPVNNPGGLLWTIVYRRGVDRVRRATQRVELKDEHADYRHHPEGRREAFDAEAQHLALVRQALSLARSLLPQLGNTTMQRVMGYWFDAAERGVERVDDVEVASAFGYTSEQVRKARERGFSRLERIARELGIVDSLDIPGRPTAADQEEDDVGAEE